MDFRSILLPCGVDSILKQEKTRSIDKLVAKYELEKIEKQQELDREIINRHQEVNHIQQLVIIISSVALFVVVLMLLIMIRIHKQRKIAFQKLKEKMQEN